MFVTINLGEWIELEMGQNNNWLLTTIFFTELNKSVFWINQTPRSFRILIQLRLNKRFWTITCENTLFQSSFFYSAKTFTFENWLQKSAFESRI